MNVEPESSESVSEYFVFRWSFDGRQPQRHFVGTITYWSEFQRALLTEISGALAPPMHSLAKLINKRVGTKENFIVAAFDSKNNKLSFSKL